MCNEWLDKSDLKLFEEMKANNPRRYQVAGLGGWGIVEGLVFKNWREEAFDLDEICALPGVCAAFGLDFGYTNDPTALFCGLIDVSAKTIWVFDELYERGLTNPKIADKIISMGYRKEKIMADYAEPKSIYEIRGYGISYIVPSGKGKDSVNNRIQFIQDYVIIIHPKCVNFLIEIANYTWSVDKNGEKINKPVDAFNHLMDAMRYALEDYMKKVVVR